MAHVSFPFWRAGEPMRRMYICDRTKCEHCTDLCDYTMDIDHALYDDHPDHLFEYGGNGFMYEKRRK